MEIPINSSYHSVEEDPLQGGDCFPPSLKSLYFLHSDEVTTECFGQLSLLTSLTSLSFSHSITDAGLVHVSTLTSLTSLSLNDDTQIPDTGVLHVSKLTLLTSLDLNNCTRITDTDIAYLSTLLSLT
eukprot:PhF_6_TR10965/c0_g2_i2/m.17682